MKPLEIKTMSTLINTDVTLDKPIDDELRLWVYKEALLYYTGVKWTDYGSHSLGLCLLLPCILWNLPSYIDTKFKMYETSIGFPELTDFIKGRISCEIYSTPVRIIYLTEWIETLEQKSNEIKEVLNFFNKEITAEFALAKGNTNIL